MKIVELFGTVYVIKKINRIFTPYPFYKFSNNFTRTIYKFSFIIFNSNISGKTIFVQLARLLWNTLEIAASSCPDKV